MDNYKKHQATELFPMIAAEEFEALKRDIAENGQREPITLVSGEVIDGRNRLRACEELGIEPLVRNLTEEEAEEAGGIFGIVMSLNFHRRHLRPHEKGEALAAYMARVGARKQQGKRTDRTSTETGEVAPTLATVARDLGIAEQTARDQLKAAEDYKAAAPELKAKVDTGEITPRKARQLTERAERVETVAAEAAAVVVPDLVTVPQKFACIYADPPWQYGNQGTRASTDNHYDTMPVEAICALPVREMVADDAHLHLWTTNAFLFDARRVMEAWGFTYKSCFVWVKPQMGIGNYWRVSHEFLLFGIRGKCPFLARDAMSWGEFPRGQHSAKPNEIRKLIERVSPGPRIELFARERHEGWSAWGNQVPSAPTCALGEA